jgi:hypothetical protein
VSAIFDIDEESVRVSTGDEVLGKWALSDVSVEDRGDALLVTLGGEAVLVDIGDRDGFAAAMSPQLRKRRKRRRRPMADSGPPDKPASAPEPVSAVAPPPAAEPARRGEASAAPRRRRMQSDEILATIGSLFSTENWSEWLADRTVRWTIAAMGVVVFAMLALFATNTLGMILVLVGMASLILGAFAVSEDFQAHQIMPDWISETGLVILGGVATAVGVVLMIAG